jgi:hypothetical protein
MQRHAIFLINLLQDVNVVRPLVYMAARDLNLKTAFLVSSQFVERDKSGTWQQELTEIGEATGSPILIYENEMQAFQLLQEKAGVLIAGSESDAPAHAATHNVFRSAPSSFVKITLQHGFECLGFLHNRAHDVAHGREVSFAADVACGWCEGNRLTSMAPSQRAKLYVSGPPAALQLRRHAAQRAPGDTGLVCENLHSVRLNVTGDLKNEFIGAFTEFCATLAAEGRNVTLRPHPGGQYLLKNRVPLPPNAVLNNHPFYKIDLPRYAYGISAPSSVLIDMVLAGIPTAVWRDPTGVIDARNYEGLTEVSTVADWVDFSREAVAHPHRFVERQQQFLERQQMPTEPEEVYRRFATLLRGSTRSVVPAKAPESERVLLIAPAYDPTVQLCLVKPLASLIESGEMRLDLLTERQMNDIFLKAARKPIARKWIAKRFALFRPTMLLFCRFGGPHTDYMFELARRDGIPILCHMDDDLLNVPESLGLQKAQRHNNPKRLIPMRFMLDNADLVYCSTKRLQERFETLRIKAPMVSGPISCSGNVIVPANERPVRRIGYMGFDKTYDLEMVLPILVAYLRRHPQVEFQLFGAFTKPPALDEFGERVKLYAPIRNYDEFLGQLARLNWDIGICPLARTDFNMLKANNKWIEYTSVGAAVIASRGTVYEESCAAGSGILAGTAEEWLGALEKLTNDPAERYAQVRRAQRKLVDEYSSERLRDQILDVFAQVKARHAKSLKDQSAPSERYRAAS